MNFKCLIAAVFTLVSFSVLTSISPAADAGAHKAGIVPATQWKGSHGAMPDGWTTREGWMGMYYRITEEEGKRFLRVEMPADGSKQAFASTASVPVDPKWASVSMAASVRASNIKPGENTWNRPMVAVKFTDAAGKEIDAGLYDWGWMLVAGEDCDWTAKNNSVNVPAGAAGMAVEINFNTCSGTLDVRDLVVTASTVKKVAAAKPQAAAVPAAPVAPKVVDDPNLIKDNATAKLPLLIPGDNALACEVDLLKELSAFHPRMWLMPNNPDAAMDLFKFVSVQGDASAEKVTVDGPGFKRAWRITSVRKPQEWMTHLQTQRTDPIKRGDVIYATAWVRAIQIPDGKPQGRGRLYADTKASGYLCANDFEIPMRWTRVHFAMTASHDLVGEDRMHWMFTFGHTPQTIEFGGLQAVNLGPNVEKSKLPHEALVLKYTGREADAPWRKEALARIEKIRKGDLTVHVTDAAGKPIADAKVKVEMKRHAYGFGTNFPISMLPAEYQQIKPLNDDFKRTAGASPADKERLQTELLRLFNCTNGGLPAWSTWGGADTRISQSDILGGLRWLTEHNIPCYDQGVIYPSPEFNSPDANKLFEAGNKEEFRKALRDWVFISAKQFSPPMRSMQIANEIEGRPQYTNLLGRESVPEWFKWVKEANPNLAAQINGPYRLGEMQIKTANRGQAWPESDGLQYYYDLISWLTKQGAPIDWIGFQNHAGVGAAGPEAMLATLDAFAAFGKELQITEYEMGVQDGNDPAQRQYQADYTRDFFIAVFSHPSTTRIMLQDFWQPAAWQFEAASCFFNKDWSMNLHGKAYEELVLKQWWTRQDGRTGATGDFATRGFLGEYEVIVTAGGKNKTVQTKLTKSGVTLKVQLD